MTVEVHAHAVDIVSIAVVMNCAVFAGLIFRFFRQPPIVGYILSGLILGQSGFGLVERGAGIEILAELGVIMLLFIIGMELSIKAFSMVLRRSLVTATGQITFAMLISACLAWIVGWNFEMALLMGFILAISSTAIVFAMLEEINALRTNLGQTVIGVMIAQDLAVVPMIMIAGTLGEDSEVSVLGTFIRLLFAVSFLLLVIRYLGSRSKITLPFTGMLKAQTGMLTLAMVAFCLALAAITGVMGLSPAYGAFLSGLFIAASTLRTDAIRVAQPVQGILIVVFFVSIGLLIDTDFLWENIWLISSLTVGSLLVKTVFNVFLLRLQGMPYDRALPAGGIMAQIGEFSFILAGIGLSVGIFSDSVHQLAVSVIALSLLMSPLWMTVIRHINERARDKVFSLKDLLRQVYGINSTKIMSNGIFGRFLAFISLRNVNIKSDEDDDMR